MQRIRRHTAVVIDRRIKIRDLILHLGNRPDRTDATRDTVADEFQTERRFRKRTEFTVRIFEPGNLQQMLRILRHRLHFLHQTHMLHSSFRHPPKQTHPTLSRIHRHTRDPGTIDLHTDPRLHPLKIRVKIHP